MSGMHKGSISNSSHQREVCGAGFLLLLIMRSASSCINAKSTGCQDSIAFVPQVKFKEVPSPKPGMVLKPTVRTFSRCKVFRKESKIGLGAPKGLFGLYLSSELLSTASCTIDAIQETNGTAKSSLRATNCRCTCRQ